MLHDDFKSAYSESFKKTMEDMYLLEPKLDPFVDSESEFKAIDKPGVASMVGFVGKVKGRCLIWFPAALAKSVTEELLEESYSDYKDEDVLNNVAEMNNVVSGQAITILNNKHKLELDLAPPSVFAGDSFSITTPKIANYKFQANINGQLLYVNLALEGGK